MNSAKAVETTHALNKKPQTKQHRTATSRKTHTTHTTGKEPFALLHKAHPRRSDPRPRHTTTTKGIQNQKTKQNNNKKTNSLNPAHELYSRRERGRYTPRPHPPTGSSATQAYPTQPTARDLAPLVSREGAAHLRAAERVGPVGQQSCVERVALLRPLAAHLRQPPRGISQAERGISQAKEAKRGEARRGEAKRGEARRGEARRGEARRGVAWRGGARRGEAGRGGARRGEAG